MADTQQKLRTALIGCGKVAATHASALQKLPRSEFVAVCSRKLASAAEFASQYDVSAYDNLETMLVRERVQVLAICTPHPSHAEIIERAASAGVHVICEKPLAPDLTSCDRAIAAARANGIKLGVISQRRFYEPVMRIKEAIDAGKIGQPVLITVSVLSWRSEAYYRSDPWRGTWSGEGGGVLVNQCPHHLDLLLWLGGAVEELYGYCDNFNHPYIEVEDTATAMMRFKSGAIGSLVLSNSQRPGLFGKVHVHGSNGASVGAEVESGSPFISGVTQHVDPPFNDIWTVPGEENLLAEWTRRDRAISWNVMTYYHERQLEEFLDAVANDHEPLVNGEAGRAVVELFTAIYASEREGKPIRFPVEATCQTGVNHATSRI